MSRATRYTPAGESVEQGPASVMRALDAVTGLPVRLYRFPGEPVAGSTELDHPHAFRVLEVGREDEQGFVVADLVDGASPVTDRPSLLDDAAAVAACSALAEAAEREIVHGDLGPHRVYRRGLDVWVEGYGVPWSDSTVSDDVRRLAAGLRDLEGNALSAGVAAALTTAAEGEMDDAPSLAAAVAAAAKQAAAHEPQPPKPAAVSFEDVVIDVESRTGATPEPVPPATPAAPAAAPRARPPARPESSPISRPKESAARPTPLEAAPERPPARGGFSKRPPPELSYRVGDTPVHQPRADELQDPAGRPDARAQRRRTWLLAALLLLAVVLAVVTAIGRQPVPPPPEATGSLSSFVVDVRLEPASLPPASLVVLESPPGSRLAPGNVLGTVPRRVVFDAEGVWRVQGRFQERHSEPFTFQLPQDREVVLRFPSSP